MNWNEVQERKKALTLDVVKDLGEAERGVFVWLLKEEKKNRAKKLWPFKQALRERVSSAIGES